MFLSMCSILAYGEARWKIYDLQFTLMNRNEYVWSHMIRIILLICMFYANLNKRASILAPSPG